MAHGIEDKAFDGMFWTNTVEELGTSVREAPWHYGANEDVVTLFDHYPTREEAYPAARHDFEVVNVDFALRAEDGGFGDAVEGWSALVRNDDTSVIYNMVKDTYTPVQNTVGWDIVDALTEGNGHSLKLASGGTLKGGRVCWVCGYLDQPETVDGDSSKSYPFLVVQWGHDGSVGINARKTTIRTECHNTLSLGELEARRSGREFTFRHTAKVADRIEECKRVLSEASDEHSAIMAQLRELGLVTLTADQRELFVKTFIPAPVDGVISERVKANIETARMDVFDIINGESIPDAHRFTAYGMVQAGIEYLDYVRGYRNHATLLGRTLLRPEPLKAKLVPMALEAANA